MDLGSRLGFEGDTGFASTLLLLVAMLLVGARRLRHVKFLEGDPLVLRFAGLGRLPSQSTLGRFLKRFNYERYTQLEKFSRELAWDSVSQLRFPRLTVDVDGSVLSTGLKVGRAFRGFNPHRRKNPSYYPITAQLAQTGHVIAHKNRPGNVHDSNGAAPFMEGILRDIRRQDWFHGIVEFRPDGAFFQRPVLELWDRSGSEYVVRVPMMPWLGLKTRIAKNAPKVWESVDRSNGVEGFFMDLPIPQWDRTERVAVFRKRVNHEPRKSKTVQLDLFNPDDGNWEYSVVATNKTLGLAATWQFYNGRSTHEKTYAELKSGYAFETIPTNHYGANTTWQKLNIIVHNLATSFQLATTAEPKPRTRKRTASFLLRSIKSLRFEWLVKAARLIKPGGRLVLRLARNAATQAAYAELDEALSTEAA